MVNNWRFERKHYKVPKYVWEWMVVERLGRRAVGGSRLTVKQDGPTIDQTLYQLHHWSTYYAATLTGILKRNHIDKGEIIIYSISSITRCGLLPSAASRTLRLFCTMSTSASIRSRALRREHSSAGDPFQWTMICLHNIRKTFSMHELQRKMYTVSQLIPPHLNSDVESSINRRIKYIVSVYAAMDAIWEPSSSVAGLLLPNLVRMTKDCAVWIMR